MGLIQEFENGVRFERNTTTLTNVLGTGFTRELGGSYILLGVSANSPCRIRLYAESSSVAIDNLRPANSFEYSASVALNLDTQLTAGTQSLTFNPPIIASTFGDKRTWYNVVAIQQVDVSITYYPIGTNSPSEPFINIPNNTGTNLGSLAKISGSITSPKSFILLAASSPSNTDIRLRLYSRPIEDVVESEKNRPFNNLSADGSHLIVDMLFDSASFLYPISPVLQAYNLEDYMNANNRVGYILENLSATPKTNVYASLGIYTLEN